MKSFKFVLIILVFLATLVFAQPSWADKPKFLKNPDYIEVSKALENLSAVKAAQSQTENYNPEEIQKKIDELEFQKYALETGVNWGQCRNETGRTIAVYGPKPDFDDDDFNYQYDNALYFLASGQTTKEKWDCNGVYLPQGVTTVVGNPDGQVQELTEPIAVKIVDGTQLIVTANLDSDAIEFSVPAAKVYKAGEANWFIPNVTQALIDTRVPNAPTAKIKDNQLVGMRTSKKDTLESNSSTEAKPQPQQKPQADVQEQTQPQQPQPNTPRASYLKRA